jgi:hypothetical protein
MKASCHPVHDNYGDLQAGYYLQIYGKLVSLLNLIYALCTFLAFLFIVCFTNFFLRTVSSLF